MQKKFFSYVRVSTQRQGQYGTSLAEQQASIERFAQRGDLQIIKCFEERETAARQGRPVFLDMLRQLRRGSADGVIIHKIDRSARNLKDWADLGNLLDSGVEVHFASESVDLNSRGGRLSADIQAVVASDFIRNLREESKKGIYGRLKQGLFPFRAPLGYLDRGKGEPKAIDPVAGPLVKRAFELYASGKWSLVTLPDKLYEIGFRNRSGGQLTTNGLFKMLHNPFYRGIIRIAKTGQIFQGMHRPIVDGRLFDQVQSILAGRNVPKLALHEFTFRRIIRCGECSNFLVGELQKGRVYYRCHRRSCSFKSIREDEIEKGLEHRLEKLRMGPPEFDMIRAVAERLFGNWKVEAEQIRDELLRLRKAIKERESRLIDCYMDGMLDKEEFLARKEQLIIEDEDLKKRLAGSGQNLETIPSEFDEFLELANSACLSLKSAPIDLKREMLEVVTSNLTAKGKSLLVKLSYPFELLAQRPAFTVGRAIGDTDRTVSAWIKQILFEAFPSGMWINTKRNQISPKL